MEQAHKKRPPRATANSPGFTLDMWRRWEMYKYNKAIVFLLSNFRYTFWDYVSPI